MDEIDRFIDETIDRWHLPGFTGVVVEPSGRPEFISRGRADVGRDVAVDERTVFRIASISKTFTAIGVMQLWEGGRLDLDDSANRHLKAYKLSRDDVTVRHLLTHTSGIGEVPTLSGLRRRGMVGMIDPKRGVPPLREMYGPVQRVGIAPGTKWAYANHAFATLGQLVEDISGRPFAEQMRESAFDALGMEETDFETTDRVRARLATGYRFKRRSRGVVPVHFRDMTTVGGGGLYSSASDMSRYLAALSAGGPPLVKPETLALMLTPQYPRDGALPATGLAFWLSEMGGRTVAGHGGDLPGFKSSMRFVPGGPGVFVSTNAGGAAGIQLSLAVDGLTERMIARLTATTDDGGARVAVREPLDLVGAYRPERGLLTNARLWMLLGGELEIIERDGALHARSPWGSRSVRCRWCGAAPGWSSIGMASSSSSTSNATPPDVRRRSTFDLQSASPRCIGGRPVCAPCRPWRSRRPVCPRSPSAVA